MTTFAIDLVDILSHYIKTHIKSPAVVVKRHELDDNFNAQGKFMLEAFPDIDILTDDDIFIVFDDEDEAVDYCHDLTEEHVYAMVFSSDGVLLSENT